MSTVISDIFHDIRCAVRQGCFGDASDLTSHLFDMADGVELADGDRIDVTLYLSDSELQFLGFIHGDSIHNKPFEESELQGNPPPKPCNEMLSSGELREVMQHFYNQGKYPYGRIINGDRRHVVYWYFQNIPTSTRIEIKLINENTKKVLWSVNVSHREMAQVLSPGVDPYEFWPKSSVEHVNMVLDAYHAYKNWRTVNRF